MPLFGVPPDDEREDEGLSSAYSSRVSRWGAPIGASADGAQLATSSFGSGVSNNAQPPATCTFTGGNDGAAATTTSVDKTEDTGTESLNNVTEDDVNDAISAAAKDAGIDRSKIPPSMREDFVASFMEDANTTDSSA